MIFKFADTNWIVGACCRIFHPHWFDTCTEEYKEVTRCESHQNQIIYGETCTIKFVTGYSEETIKVLRADSKKSSALGLGWLFHVEGYTSNEKPFLDQIRTRFTATKNEVNGNTYLHSWESGLTNVFILGETHERKKTTKCVCDGDEDNFPKKPSAKVQTYKVDPRYTLKLYTYTSPPGFYVRTLQVYGNCTSEKGNTLDVNTGSIRSVAIPTPAACPCTNKWLLLRKYSTTHSVRIKIIVPQVGVIWHAEPEQTVLNFLSVTLEGFMHNISSSFNKSFPGKEEADWKETMKSTSVTWKRISYSTLIKNFRLNRNRVHLIFQLVGKCASHFTVYTDQIKHVTVWSPQICNATDNWVLVGTYSTRNEREKRIRHWLDVGVQSVDYRNMRDYGVYYAHPSRDLKSRFIEQCTGVPKKGDLKRTYFNWNMTQFKLNWEEILLPSSSPLSPDTPAYIANHNKQQVIPVDITVPANYTYAILQLQGKCRSHYVYTDRLLQIRMRETIDCKAVENYVHLGLCDNSNDAVNRKSCTYEMKPFGVLIEDYTSEIISLLNLKERANQIKLELQQKFPDVDLMDDCHWRTIYAPYNKTLCGATRTFEIPPLSTFKVEQLRVECNEWKLYAYKFRGIDQNGFVEYDTPIPGSWKYVDGKLVSFNSTTKN